MSDGRRRLRLDDLALIVTGSTPKSSNLDAWGDEVDFITPSDQVADRRGARPERRLSTAGALLLQKRLVPAGSTALTCIGSTIGKVSRLREDSVTNQQINTVIARHEVADPSYLYYLIREWSPGLRVAASGSATPIVNKSVLAQYVFEVPNLETQRAVGSVLDAIDDKIAANDLVIAKADELRRDGVAAAAGVGDERPLSDLAQFVNGRPFTKGATGSGRIVIRIAELNSGLGPSTVYSNIEVADEHVARPGDLLFAWSGSLTVSRWYRDEAIINQHIFKVVPNGVQPKWLVDYALRAKLAEFKSIAADKATTMGHIQRRHLDEPVMIPVAEDVGAMDESMTALWDRALTAEVESLQLARTRDDLLPLLLSGKIRVKDAEKVVEEVK